MADIHFEKNHPKKRRDTIVTLLLSVSFSRIRRVHEIRWIELQKGMEMKGVRVLVMKRKWSYEVKRLAGLTSF